MRSQREPVRTATATHDYKLASYLPEVPHGAVDPQRVGRDSRDPAFCVVSELSQGSGRSCPVNTVRAATRRRRLGLRTLSYYTGARQRSYDSRRCHRTRTAWYLKKITTTVSPGAWEGLLRRKTKLTTAAAAADFHHNARGRFGRREKEDNELYYFYEFNSFVYRNSTHLDAHLTDIFDILRLVSSGD